MRQIGEDIMAIEPGHSAPDFTLASTKGDPIAMSNLRGKKVVLAFFPAAFTGG